MLRVHLLVAAILILPTAALASDVSSTMAALKDEASECRYVASLCKQINDEIAAEAGQSALRTRAQLREAERMLTVKHEKMPSCYTPCNH
jgi:hypothetical protein